MAKAKRAKKLNPAIRLLLVVAFLYIAGTFITNIVKVQMQISEKKQELTETNAKITAQEVKNEELNNQLNAKVDYAYVEKIARERGFVDEGEIVYDNITDE
ncbi:MAG: septum formation initiator family protein [Clostridia bacterium]|nr:septum formation initiator family protein [Clostridia bacterium]